MTVDDELCVHPTACRDLLQHVLFPTDFLENADLAFPVVKALSALGAQEITLLHVQDSSRIHPHLSDRLNEFNRIDEQRLTGLKLSITAETERENVSIHISYGRPVPEILRLSKELGATCLVLGRHGRGAIAEAALGGTSHNVIRHAEVPVLTVPNDR